MPQPYIFFKGGSDKKIRQEQIYLRRHKRIYRICVTTLTLPDQLVFLRLASISGGYVFECRRDLIIEHAREAMLG